MPPVLNEHEYMKCEFSTAACIEQRERACVGTIQYLQQKQHIYEFRKRLQIIMIKGDL